MHPNQDDAARSASAAAARIERLYDRCGAVLKYTLTASFRVPADVAETMLEDAFRALITSTVPDEEAWLIAAVCRLGTTYRAATVLDAKMPPDICEAETRALQNAVLLRDAVERLPENARQALRLRFELRYGYEQIAECLDVSPRYAKRLIIRSLQKLQSEKERR